MIRNKLLTVSMTALLFTACSSNPTTKEFSASADPSQEIQKLNEGVNQAYSDQANVLAPDFYKKAEKYLKYAKQDRGDNDSNKKVLEQVAIGNAWLSKANETTKFANENIPDVIQARARALAVKADQYDKDNFSSADSDIVDMGEGFEKNKTVSQKDRTNLTRKYGESEIVGLKGTYLGQAKNNIYDAKKEGAAKITPQTLNDTQKKYNDAGAFIVANPQNISEIQKICDDATSASDRLLKITRQAKVDKNKTPEQIALEAEKSRNQRLHLSGEVSSLAAGATLDKKFAEAQSQFDPSEAEVYKQGDKILIRLKALNFPSGTATLTTETYPLLAKVQATLKEMGNSQVVIQGNTDSLGSRQANQKLSEARADAVKSYLINNQAVNEDKINAEGYGDKKPLASNKTKEGRAENRRVDIVITPE